MKRFFQAFIFFHLCVLLVQAAPPAGYYQVWGDEFNSTSLDTTKWDYWLLGARRDAVNVTNAVSLDGSHLLITTYTSNSVNYTAMVATDGTFRPRFGYWEASIKWADTNGMWSAMWLQSPTMGTYLNNPFVSGSEIDVVEHRSTDGASNGNIINQVQNNIHWNGYGSSAASAGSGNIGTGLGSGYHTYGLLWTPSNYNISIDGSGLRNWNYAQNSVPISLSTEWFILSSEVDDTSTTWAGTIPAGGYGSLATSTTKMSVDYVRYYAPTNYIFWAATNSTDLVAATNYIGSMPPLATSDVIFSQLSGNNLNPTLGSNLSVDGLVFTWMNNGVTIGGTNTLTLGAGGVDMISANHSVALNCPINIGTAQTWNFGPNNPGNTLTVNGNLSGSATLSKGSYGKLILAGTNSFTGTLNVGTGSTTTNDGILQLASSGAAANAAGINIANNNGGSSTLQLIGGITVPPPINLSGRNTNVLAIENVSGSNTLAGAVTINVGGGFYIFQSDAGTLNLAGGVSSVATGTRNLTFQGAGDHYVSGAIQNGSATTINLTKQDAGTLHLAGANTFSGAVTVGGGAVKLNYSRTLENNLLYLASAGSNALRFGPVTGASVGGLFGINDIWLTNSSLTAVMLTNGSSVNSDYAGSLKGPGGLVKTGTGTLSLAASNSYTGATIISAGTVRLSSATNNFIASLQPVLWMSFDQAGNGVVTNQGTAGWSMNGALIGTGAYITNAGRFGSALYVNGTGANTPSNIVQISSKVVDTSASGSWTIGYWIKTTTAGAVIMYQGDGGWSSSGQTTYLLNANSSSTAGTKAGSVRWAGGFLTGSTALTDGNWHFIALVDTVGSETIYVDGNVDTVTSTMGLALSAGANQTWIGGSPDSDAGAVKMTGMIDEVCMFGRALSAAEIRGIFTNAPTTGKLPPASTVTVASGATLDLNGNSQTVAMLGDGSGGGMVTNSGAVPVTLTIGGTAAARTFSGNIADTAAANAIGLVKNGAAIQTLAGNNSYRGPTTVNAGSLLVNGSLGTNTVTVAGGTLGGSGIIPGAVLISGGTLAPGSSGVGLLTCSNNLTLQFGSTTVMELDKPSGTNDQLRVSGALNYGGTLSVASLSGGLTGGDSFKLFSAGSFTANFNSIAGSPGTGMAWKFNPTNGVLTVYSTVSTNLSALLTGNTLQLSWPADHLGWMLQVQTNDLNAGLGTNWFSIDGSTTNTQFFSPLDAGSPSVFYRLFFQ